MVKTNLKALSQKQLAQFIEQQGQKPYRSQQIIRWIYKKRASSIEEMTDLSKSFREKLNEIAYISNLKLLKKQISKDGTQKYLFELEDGEAIESVLIPVGTTRFRDKDRLTLCISSQVGCAMGCTFCVTGKLGLKRNLMAYEIVDQVIAVQTQLHDGEKITNIVLMGMGEPLHNFAKVTEALWRMTGLLGISKRRITLSTAGIPAKILELAKKGPGVNLAISLNATTDKVRNKIMPINRRYPLKELFNACRRFPLEPRRRITFEYVLLDGINDSKEDARRLIRLLHGIRSKVNLIPLNPASRYTTGQNRIATKLRRSSEKKVLAFQKILLDSGMTAIIRKSMGGDISAACGQLKAAYK
jgi:23S rRNA (adenine2503-C2)-methyltransferase